MKLAEVCIRRPVFTVMMVLALVVIGGFSYMRLGVDRFPRVDFPVVTVTTTLPGASPEEVETQITKRVEEAVNTIEGIDELRSITVEGVSQVIVTFVLERDADVAAQDVRDRVSRILKNFPEGTDPPIIEKLDIDASPIMSLAVSGHRDMREITEIADKQLKEMLESTSGVGQIRLIGDRKREIQVYFDPQKLAAYDIMIPQLRRALASQNVEIPGGRIDLGNREVTVRTLGRIARVEDFKNIIITDRGGVPIRFSDIGAVVDGFEEPRTLARLDRQPAVILEVRKQSGANTVAVVDALKARLEQLKQALPPDMTVQIIRDQSTYINNSFKAIRDHLIEGSILAALVVLFFMWNFRSTIIAGVAIPTSIISTFALMYYANFTMNAQTMLALALMIGIVIDDAIVVLENIYRHIEEKKKPPMQAAKEATSEIGLAVMATTLSLVVIFLPVAFMGGIMGRFYRSFGLTSTFAIMVSLLISFTLTPMLCSRFLKNRERRLADEKKRPRTSKESWFYSRLERGYMGMLGWSLHHRWMVVGVALLIIFSSVPLAIAIGKDFIPFEDESQFEITVRAPEGISLQGMDELMQEIEREVRELPGVTSILTTIGAGGQQRVSNGAVYVKLIDLDQRDYTQFDVMAQARRLLKKYPNLRVSVQNIAVMSGGGFRAAAVQYTLQGPDIHKLTQYSDHLQHFLRSIPGVVDVDSTLETGKPEVGVAIDRERAAALGVSVEDVARSLRTVYEGDDRVTQPFREGDELYEVRLRVAPEFRTDPAVLQTIYVPSARGHSVPLSNLVKVSERTGPAQIERYNRQRQLTLLANMEGKQIALAEVLSRLRGEIDRMNLEPGYFSAPTGRSRELGRAAQNFAIAFALSVVFMYMVLAAQFESFLDPVIIMVSLPLSVPFALFSLYATTETLNIFSAVGLLLLFGIVKKNAILQVDRMNALRHQGLPRFEAIMQANRDRLRPILMTTITIVAGMFPMALSFGPGSALRRPVSIAVIGGQTLCLLITLLVIPVVYTLFADTNNWIKDHWRRRKKQEPEPLMPEEELEEELEPVTSFRQQMEAK
ncbi:MAG: efflux RND transporter permease subunit [Acidobacteria bacterium]|nr:efflux RND transporter permease subunit [Acidobacteriota bacterium]